MTDDRLLAAKKKFSRLLKEIFQFDCADLDFGIYRILAMRRTELERFLDDELLPQVEGILAAAAGDRVSVQSELSKLESSLRDAGIQDFSSSPKWNELMGKLAASPDIAALAREVFSDLTTFFARYYDEGDFMALPRYKGDTYAIPYDGSEVKLHWANADQYYIKTTEQHADYTAVIDGVSGLEKPRLRFRLAAAESDRDNNKSTEKRRYVLRTEAPVEVDGNELTVWFEYRVPEPGKGRQPTQNSLCEESEKVVLSFAPTTWQAALTRKASQNPEKYTVLGYQLYRYTKKNTSDYFIHKDLGGFLRRELDFFIKNEVLFLDDIEGRTSSDVDVALQKVKAIRAVGAKIIDWLAQIEDFQKRLYLKKKFVVRHNWLVSLDLVPDAFLEEIAANESQVEEWRTHLRIDRMKGDLVSAGFSTPLSGDFLRSHKSLSLSLSHFDTGFQRRLFAELDSGTVEGAHIAACSDNFHALRLFGSLLREQVQCVFIDPPYNTGNDDFMYKDNYQDSSWVTMMSDRLAVLAPMLRRTGVLFATIDDREVALLRLLFEKAFGAANFVTHAIWHKKYARQNDATWFSTSHDHILVAALDKSLWRPNRLPRSDQQNSGYRNPDNDPRGPWQSVVYTCNKSADERPNLYYAIRHPKTGEEIWPKRNRVWAFSQEAHEQNEAIGKVWWGIDQEKRMPRQKVYLADVDGGVVPNTLWERQDVGDNQDAQRQLTALFGSEIGFSTPKPWELVRRAAVVGSSEGDVIADFFAGSGATAHAVLEMNRGEDIDTESARRFFVVEMAGYFESLLMPRIQKVALSPNWADGVPAPGPGVSYSCRSVWLESYEDALENIELQRPDAGELFGSSALREDYTLRYMLNLEAEGSLLNLERFRKPWDYTIKVRRDGVVQDSPVDLVETFNCLIGLRVRRYDNYGQEGLLFIIGTDPEGRRVIVVWRDCDLWPNDRLEEKCRQAFESFRPDEFDLVYVNGDNHLPIIKTGEESWKVNLIEETFHARMFDTSDVE